MENITKTKLTHEVKDQIAQLLLLLNQKEKFVIEKRFNLDDNKKFTLEEIGQEFNVTRERIRQIEKSALQKLKRNIATFDINQINELAFNYLQSAGGVLKEEILVSQILTHKPTLSTNFLNLILSLDKRFSRHLNTIEYHPYFRMNIIPVEWVTKITEEGAKILNKINEPLEIDDLIHDVTNKIEESKTLQKSTFQSIFSVYKHFKILENKIGLQKWRHINPKTLRDKIYFILRNKKKAMHFVDISNAIINSSFDKKHLNLQAIHNELIRHEDFILIGRGIYALKEWGYQEGTVADVIESILKKHESLDEEQIVSEVLKIRQVKPITVLLNLKNKPQFQRIGRKQYEYKN